MKNINQPKLHISLSKEHNKYQSDVADAFNGLDISFGGSLMRFSSEEMTMQIILNLGIGIASSAIWDAIKVGIKKLHKKFTTAHITLRDAESVMYTVKPDLSVTVLVVSDRTKEFEHIKTIDDLVKHLKKNYDPSVPTGWKRVTLGDLFDFKNGLNSEKENFGHGVRFINIMEILKHDFLVAENIPGRINVDPKRNKENIVEYGDVLFNRTSETPDEIGMTSVYLDTEPVVFGGFVIRAKPKSKELNDLFKKYCFSSSSFRKEVIKNGQGVVRGNIGQGDLKLIPFLLPPIREQDRIASVLETWNKLIEKLTQKIEIKKQIKKGLMQELLTGKKRLSGFSNKWETLNLGSIGQIVTGNTPSKKIIEHYGGKYLWATALDFNGVYIENTDIKLSESGKKISRTVPPGSILVTCIASLGKNAIAKKEMGFNQQINAIIPNKKHNSEFIYYLIGNSGHKLKEVAGGGALAMISKGVFEKIKLTFPNLEEQKAIANILTTADKEINELEKKLSIIKEQKRYLLNNLITGTIRTPETLSTK